MHRRLVHAALAAGLLVLLAAGCTSGTDSLEEVDPGAAPLHPTWSQVEPILERNCVPCHKGGERNYTSCQTARRELGDLKETAIREGSMPPGAWPRLDERQKLILERWIDDRAPCGN